MKKINTFLIVFALIISNRTLGQKIMDCDERPYIEVRGSAELEVVPDEIFIHIIIREKYENRVKLTIESQEEKLKAFLKEAGIDITNLSLSDANADYVSVKWRKKDVLTKKEYTLKVSSANSVGLAFLQFDKLEITDAFISKVSHTKLDSLKKSVKIAAIKAAKNKAEYLLSAINEQIDKPLIVQELDNGVMPLSAVASRGSRSGNINFSLPLIEQDIKDNVDELQFSKIKVSAIIYIKYAIK